MNKFDFLSKITYSTNYNKKELTIWYENMVINTISFEDNSEKLDDDEYCSNLSEDVALESTLANNLINDE